VPGVYSKVKLRIITVFVESCMRACEYVHVCSLHYTYVPTYHAYKAIYRNMIHIHVHTYTQTHYTSTLVFTLLRTHTKAYDKIKYFHHSSIHACMHTYIHTHKAASSSGQSFDAGSGAATAPTRCSRSRSSASAGWHSDDATAGATSRTSCSTTANDAQIMPFAYAFCIFMCI
jgi:hypothetical protein